MQVGGWERDSVWITSPFKQQPPQVPPPQHQIERGGAGLRLQAGFDGLGEKYNHRYGRQLKGHLENDSSVLLVEERQEKVRRQKIYAAELQKQVRLRITEKESKKYEADNSRGAPQVIFPNSIRSKGRSISFAVQDEGYGRLQEFETPNKVRRVQVSPNHSNEESSLNPLRILRTIPLKSRVTDQRQIFITGDANDNKMNDLLHRQKQRHSQRQYENDIQITAMETVIASINSPTATRSTLEKDFRLRHVLHTSDEKLPKDSTLPSHLQKIQNLETINIQQNQIKMQKNIDYLKQQLKQNQPQKEHIRKQIFAFIPVNDIVSPKHPLQIELQQLPKESTSAIQTVTSHIPSPTRETNEIKHKPNNNISLSSLYKIQASTKEVQPYQDRGSIPHPTSEEHLFPRRKSLRSKSRVRGKSHNSKQQVQQQQQSPSPQQSQESTDLQTSLILLNKRINDQQNYNYFYSEKPSTQTKNIIEDNRDSDQLASSHLRRRKSIITPAKVSQESQQNHELVTHQSINNDDETAILRSKSLGNDSLSQPKDTRKKRKILLSTIIPHNLDILDAIVKASNPNRSRLQQQRLALRYKTLVETSGNSLNYSLSAIDDSTTADNIYSSGKAERNPSRPRHQWN